MSQNPALSRNDVPIRLTDERWQHIIEEHAELKDLRHDVLQTICKAERVLTGKDGELFAARMVEDAKALIVVYRELDRDGFVITAFLTSRMASLSRREQIWPPQT